MGRGGITDGPSSKCETVSVAAPKIWSIFQAKFGEYFGPKD